VNVISQTASLSLPPCWAGSGSIDDGTDGADGAMPLGQGILPAHSCVSFSCSPCSPPCRVSWPKLLDLG